MGKAVLKGYTERNNMAQKELRRSVNRRTVFADIDTGGLDVGSTTFVFNDHIKDSGKRSGGK